MWVFLNTGSVSVVAHRELADCLLVRARERKHLQAALGTDDGIEETPTADYRFRAVVKREDWALRLGQLSMEIDYDNFKKSIKDPEFLGVAEKCWAVGANAFGAFGRKPSG